MNKKLITNLLIFAALFLAVWFGILPVWSEISTVRAEIKSKEGTVNLERQVIEKLNSINQVLDSQKSSVERLEQAIPTTESKPELLSIMENLASQNGLSLKGVNIEVAPEDTAAAKRSARTPDSISLKKIIIDISASGSYSSFKSWLDAVEKNLRITDISKITFKIPEKKSDTGAFEPNIDPVIDYSVAMTAYVLKK
jgi:Tfp pilus assembly protein PilO